MKIFRRWFGNMCKRAWEEAQQSEKESMGQIKMSSGAAMVERGMGSDADLNFRMYKAENGHVMEVRHYDRRTDRHNNKLYLITDDQDLGAEISKIITVESLRA